MLRTSIRNVALKVKAKAEEIAEALEGASKAEILATWSDAYRVPMTNGPPAMVLVTTREMRRTWADRAGHSDYLEHDFIGTWERGKMAGSCSSIDDGLIRFIRAVSGQFIRMRVDPSALCCQQCNGVGITNANLCQTCDGTGNRAVRDCVRHIALNLQKSVPSDDHDALLHVASIAMTETDDLFKRICEQWPYHHRSEYIDGMRACVIFYLGALARVSLLGTDPRFSKSQSASPMYLRMKVLAGANRAAGMYASMIAGDSAPSYHRSESARLLTLLGLESRSGGLTVDSLGMTIFTEVRPDGITVQDVWSPEFFRKVMDDCGTSLQGDLFADYVQRVNQITWTIESTAQTAGMLPGESLAAFIERLRLERNDALDKLSEALSTLNG
jgi:hypothetical protein